MGIFNFFFEYWNILCFASIHRWSTFFGGRCHILTIFPEFSRFFSKNSNFPEFLSDFDNFSYSLTPPDSPCFHVFQVCEHPVLRINHGILIKCHCIHELIRGMLQMVNIAGYILSKYFL